MTLQFRYLAGLVAGVVLGLLLPLAGGDTLAVMQGLAELVITASRFLLFPLVFFGMIIACDELRSEERLFPVAVRSVLWTAMAVAAATVIGAASVVLLAPQRIPPMIQESQIPRIPTVLEAVQQGFRGNFFQVFVLHENALGGMLLTALLIGAVLNFDRGVTSPVFLVADSVNRIFYRLNRLLVEVMGVLLVVPAAAVMVKVRGAADLGLFAQLLLVVGFAAALVGFVVYPVVLYVLDRRNGRPMVWVRAMIAPVVPALLTGDSYAALGTLLPVAKEQLGIHRRFGASVLPAVALFGRAGSALVAMAGCLLVIRSYTALEVGFGELVQLAVAAVLYSFLLARVPSGGVLMLLSFLALRYGRGMEESYLILLPVMPLLERIGAVLDVMTAGFVGRVIQMKYAQK